MSPMYTKQRQPMLFANIGEAIVFWISAAAVIALLALSLFRFVDFNSARAASDALQNNHREIILEINRLKVENASLIKSNREMMQRIDSLAHVLSLSHTSRVKVHIKKITPLEKNSRLFLNKSK